MYCFNNQFHEIDVWNIEVVTSRRKILLVLSLTFHEYSFFPSTSHAPDYNMLTSLMKEISLKIVNNGGIVRSIQNHGIRQLPHRFKAKYADREGNRYYEKGRFISVFYDANPNVMKQVSRT